MEIVNKILELFGYFLALTLAVDVVTWSYSGKTSNTGVSLLQGIISKITILPIAILQLVFNVAVGLVLGILKMIIGRIFPSVARELTIAGVDVLTPMLKAEAAANCQKP